MNFGGVLFVEILEWIRTFFSPTQRLGRQSPDFTKNSVIIFDNFQFYRKTKF